MHSPRWWGKAFLSYRLLTFFVFYSLSWESGSASADREKDWVYLSSFPDSKIVSLGPTHLGLSTHLQTIEQALSLGEEELISLTRQGLNQSREAGLSKLEVFLDLEEEGSSIRSILDKTADDERAAILNWWLNLKEVEEPVGDTQKSIVQVIRNYQDRLKFCQYIVADLGLISSSSYQPLPLNVGLLPYEQAAGKIPVFVSGEGNQLLKILEWNERLSQFSFFIFTEDYQQAFVRQLLHFPTLHQHLLTEKDMGTLSKLPELKKNQEQQKQQIEDLKRETLSIVPTDAKSLADLTARWSLVSAGEEAIKKQIGEYKEILTPLLQAEQLLRLFFKRSITDIVKVEQEAHPTSPSRSSAQSASSAKTAVSKSTLILNLAYSGIIEQSGLRSLALELAFREGSSSPHRGASAAGKPVLSQAHHGFFAKLRDDERFSRFQSGYGIVVSTPTEVLGIPDDKEVEAKWDPSKSVGVVVVKSDSAAAKSSPKPAGKGKK